MTILKWKAPTTFTDGSAFGQGDFKGFSFDIDGQPAISVPMGWDTDGDYELDITAAVAPIAPETRATHAVRMYTVAQLSDAQRTIVTSDPSAPVSFTLDQRKPKPPFGVAVV